ncbi:MAG: CotH kinase family protein [Ruminococcus sp.]|nr:CotH kinase family protein [Ruminococcus sp.]
MLKTAKRCMAFGVAAVMAVSFVGCKNSSNKKEETEQVKAETLSYENKLFDTSYVHTINVEIADDDWEDLKANPTQKTKYQVDITIDGETINDVSFSTKGNTSLSSVSSDSDSDRYSFKVNFGKYVENQTYYGLNKLNLNNIYADATDMKDYISYKIFDEAGVDSPLVSYVDIQINGEEFGLYLAIEDISESYLNRTNDGEGELYKPETSSLANMGGGKGNIQPPSDMEMPDGMEFPNDIQAPDNADSSENMERPNDMKMPGGNGFPNGDMFSDDNGASLKYTDDEVSSYSDIFDNTITNSDEEDWNKVIAALKSLSEDDAESAVDTDEVIRYFAAHNFVLNYDSYTGNMLHNYFLYENDGKLSLLPWDYNLAFGTFSGGGEMGNGENATALINTGIDSPLSGADEADRPFWKFIASDEDYLEQYHKVYDELISSFFESGKFESELERVYNMIRPYVEKDTSAFYTVDEFDDAYETLNKFCLLRAESIRKQLSGELASISDEQTASEQVDASDISIKTMGMQNNKGFDAPQMPGGMKFPDNMTPPDNKGNNIESAT